MSDYIISYGNLNNFILTTPSGERIPCHNLATARTLKRAYEQADAEEAKRNNRNKVVHKSEIVNPF